MLASIPQNDGTTKVTVDYQYFIAGKRPRYFQHYTKSEAEERAYIFLARRETEPHFVSGEVTHKGQAFYVTYIVRR